MGYDLHLSGVPNLLKEPQAQRVRTLLDGGDKHLRKFFQMFYHKLHPKNGILIDGKDGFSESIYLKLKKLGAPESAFILSSVDDDKSEISLRSALEKTIGYNSGTIISSIAGSLAFWESDDLNYRYILLGKGK